MSTTITLFAISVGDMDKVDLLRKEIAKRESELANLRLELAVVEAEEKDEQTWKWPLQLTEYERYSRQMIVPRIGLQGVFPR